MSSSSDWINGLVAIQGSSGPVGVGFIVSGDGLIVTSAHVLDAADWHYREWQEPIEIRFQVNRQPGKATVIEGSHSPVTESDLAILRTVKPLPDGVKVLQLWEARRATGRNMSLWGYPKVKPEGVGGTARVLQLGRKDRDHKELQLLSEEVIEGYSGSPLWDAARQRVMGMVIEGIKDGPLDHVKFAVPTEMIVALSQKQLKLSRPTSSGQQISIAVDDLVDEYTSRPIFGRDGYFRELDSWSDSGRSGLRAVLCQAGLGKTSLMAHWLRRRQQDGYTVAYHFFSATNDYLRPVDNAYDHLLEQLSNHFDLQDKLQELKDEGSAKNLQLSAMVAECSNSLRDGKRLIIILDGVDEADGNIAPLVASRDLPDGLFVVVTARTGPLTEGQGLPDYLAEWMVEAREPIELRPLNESDIRTWLGKVSDGAMAAAAEDKTFLSQLTKKTKGHPLYARFLIKDLIEQVKLGRSPNELIEEAPKGLDEYAKKQLNHLKKARLDPQYWRFLALLAVSPAALHRDDLKVLLSRNGQAPVLDLIIDEQHVARWLSKRSSDTYVLSHPLLTESFRKAFGHSADDAVNSLLELCRQKNDQLTPFALRYYADLLQQEKEWDELYELARDRAYYEKQPEAEPQIRLRPVRLALDAACEQGRADLIAEFLLEHGRRLLAQPTPLQALRGGTSQVELSLAWRMAEDRSAKRRILWHLLLACELAMNNRHDASMDTLARLENGSIPKLSSPWDTLGSWLSVQLIANGVTDVMSLINTILPNKALQKVCLLALEVAGLDAAREINEGILDSRTKEKTMVELVRALAGSGRIPQAKELASEAVESYGPSALAPAYRAVVAAQSDRMDFDGAMETVNDIDQNSNQIIARARATIAIAQFKAELEEPDTENIVAAKEAVASIPTSEERDPVLWAIAKDQAEAGDHSGALKTVQDISDDKYQSMALTEIAIAQLSNELEDQAENTFSRALYVAFGVLDEFNRSDAMSALVTALASAGDYIRAVSTARAIDDDGKRADAFQEIARAQAANGDFDGAFATIDNFPAINETEDTLNKNETLTKISEIQAERPDIGAALETVSKIQGYQAQAKALKAIAIAQARARDFSGARYTTKNIRDMNLRIEALAEVALVQSESAPFQEVSETLALALVTDRLNVAGDRDKTLQEICLILSSQPDLDLLEADAAARSIRNEVDQATAYRMIVKVHARQANYESARSAAVKIGNEVIRAEALTDIAVIQAGEGDLARAFETVSKIDNRRSRAEAHKSIAISLAAVAETDRAKETSMDITDADLKAWALAEVGAVQHKQGKLQDATETFAMAQETAAGLDEDKREAELRRMVRIRALAGDVEGAREMSLDIGAEQWTLPYVVAGQAEAGKLDAALKTVDDIKDSALKIRALITVANAFAQSGFFEKALDICERANNVAKDIVFGRRRAELLIEIAGVQVLAESNRDAIATFTLAIDAVQDLGVEFRAEMLSNIAAAQAKAGLGEYAVRTANSVLFRPDKHLPRILMELARQEDSACFDQLLLICADDPRAALRACGAVAQRYKDEAPEISRLFMKHSLDWAPI